MCQNVISIELSMSHTLKTIMAELSVVKTAVNRISFAAFICIQQLCVSMGVVYLDARTTM